MISVIIPLYNKSQCIYRTIQSVLEQTYTDFEIVVINDGSTDEGPLIVQKIDDNRIRLITQPNAGVSAARNRGVREAKGEWMLFLDADDILYSDALDVLFSKSYLNVNIVSGNFNKSNGVQFYKGIAFSREGKISNNYFSYYWDFFSIRTGCALIHKSLLSKYQFDESLSRYEDLKFIMEILKEAKVYNTKHVVLEYRMEHSSAKYSTLNIAKDYTFGMTFTEFPFWGKCLLGDLLFLASMDFPAETKKLRLQYGRNYGYRYISSLMIRSKHLIAKLYDKFFI